jgi:hemolysin III
MKIKYSSVAEIDEVKPMLRGQFHHFGFYAFIVAGIMVIWKLGKFEWSYLVYLVSLLAVYGTSAAFHVINWENKTYEVIMQQLDHANIFLLIAGTYTPVCVSCLPFEEMWVKQILIAAWSIAILGVLKCIFWTNPPKLLNVAFYFICGLTIVPFMPKIFKVLHPAIWGSFVAGGAVYLLGGLVYGFEYPDPNPDIFGYHEIFHICTLIANTCFFVPIVYCIFKGYSQT